MENFFYLSQMDKMKAKKLTMAAISLTKKAVFNSISTSLWFQKYANLIKLCQPNENWNY